MKTCHVFRRFLFGTALALQITHSLEGLEASYPRVVALHLARASASNLSDRELQVGSQDLEELRRDTDNIFVHTSPSTPVAIKRLPSEHLRDLAPDGVVWTGRSEDQTIWITLVVRSSGVSGLLTLGPDTYRLLSTDTGLIARPVGLDKAPRCGSSLEGSNLAPKQHGTCNDPDDYEPADAPVGIDVIQLFTPEACAASNGAPCNSPDDEVAILNILDQALLDADFAFRQSNAPILLNRVFAGQVTTYTEAVHQDPARDNFRSNQEIADLRNYHSADLVALFVSDLENDIGPTCGVVSRVMARDDVGPQYSEEGFQLTVVESQLRPECGLDRFTYAHEHGHNLGLRHDPVGGTEAPELGSFCFAFGHFVSDPADGFRTVMSTATGCGESPPPSDPSYCPRVQFFSDPDLPLPRTSYFTGQEDRDNVRVLELTAPIAAKFRASNDHFRNLEPLAGSSGEITGSNYGATIEEPDEPTHAGVGGSGSVWWEWTPPYSGQAAIDTAGSNFDTLLAVYTGETLGTLTEVASASNSPGTASVTFQAAGGTTYKIAVDGPLVFGTGDIAVSWDISLGTADLAVALADAPDPILLGQSVTLSTTISNLGPDSATDATLLLGIPPNLDFLSWDPPEACTEDGSYLTCVFPSIAPGADHAVAVAATGVEPGTGTSDANVTARENEVLPADNNTSITDTTFLAAADLAVSVVDLSDPVILGENVNWLVSPTNNGPSFVSDAVLDATLSGNANFINTSRPDICSFDSNTLTCLVGDLDPVTSPPPIELTASSSEAGIALLNLSLTAALPDPMTFNNTEEELTIVSGTGEPTEQIIVSSPPMQNFFFGRNLGVQEPWLVVANEHQGHGPGPALFRHEAGNWVQFSSIEPPDDPITAGWSVDLDLDTLVFGAPGEEFPGDPPVPQAGAAYVYTWDGSGWNFLQKLHAPSPSPVDTFGRSVSLHDSHLLVDGPFDDQLGENSGAVYAFRREAGSWTFQQKILASDGEALDYFGLRIRVKDNSMAATSRDTAYLFDWSGSSWHERETLRDIGQAHSLGLSDNVLAIGEANAEGPNGGANLGQVRLFSRQTTGWEETVLRPDLQDPGDFFGASLALQGELLAVGAPGAGVAGGMYVFHFVEGSWHELALLRPGDEAAATDSFGSSVSISGSTIFIGAYTSDPGGVSQAGSVYVYDLALAVPRVFLDAPSAPKTYVLGDTEFLGWSSEDSGPGDEVVLSMKRDAVATSATEPDGVNWVRFTDGTPNDGGEMVAIPRTAATASDWRFYARLDSSGAFDATDFTFSVVPDTADLSVALIDSPDPVMAGSEVSYTITVTNSGPFTAELVEVASQAPAGTTFSSTSGCAEDPLGLPTCSIGSIAEGSSMEFSLVLSVSPETRGSLVYSASVSSSTQEEQPGDESSTETTNIVAFADLELTVSDVPDPVEQNEPLFLTADISNSGLASATEISVVIELPSGTIYEESSPSGVCRDNGGSIACNLEDLAPGSGAQVVLRLRPTEVGTVTTAVTLSAAESDPDRSNNSVILDTVIIPNLVFSDGFESGDTSVWSTTTP